MKNSPDVSKQKDTTYKAYKLTSSTTLSKFSKPKQTRRAERYGSHSSFLLVQRQTNPSNHRRRTQRKKSRWDSKHNLVFTEKLPPTSFWRLFSRQGCGGSLAMNCPFCGYIWKNRVSSPVECPRCKRRLDHKPKKRLPKCFRNMWVLFYVSR